MLFAVSDHQTVRLNLADGSVTEFRGHADSHHCQAEAMVLSDDDTVLCVAYIWAQCIVAYDVATLQLTWRVSLECAPCSVAYHDGTVLFAANEALVTVVSAADGSVVRTLGRAGGMMWGISVFAGMRACMMHDAHMCWA